MLKEQRNRKGRKFIDKRNQEKEKKKSKEIYQGRTLKKKKKQGEKMRCPRCKGTEIEADSARGDLVCTNCGLLLEESAVVSSIEFSENAAGMR